MAEYLHQTFPNNSYFQRYYARMLYSMGLHQKLIPVAESILDKIDQGFQGYEENSGRYAAFFLGQYHLHRKNKKQSKKYFQLAVEYGEEVGAQEKGYHLYSLVSLGEIAADENDEETAKYFF